MLMSSVLSVAIVCYHNIMLLVARIFEVILKILYLLGKLRRIKQSNYITDGLIPIYKSVTILSSESPGLISFIYTV